MKCFFKPKPAGKYRSGYDFFDFFYEMPQFLCSLFTPPLHRLNHPIVSLQVHFVHFNKKYGSLGAAVSQSDGLLVFGNFINVSFVFATFSRGVNLASRFICIFYRKLEEIRAGGTA